MNRFNSNDNETNQMNIILFRKKELDQPISIHDNRIRHVCKILNCKPGDKFDIGIINGVKGEAWIEKIQENQVILDYTLEDKIQDQLYPITLLIGHSRPQSIKKILREVTALGVSKIIITGTDTGEKSYFQSSIWKDNKIQKYLIEGAQQAHSTLLPVLKKYDTLKKGLLHLSETPNKFALDNIRGYERLSALNIEYERQIILAVGSERGWSDRERELLQKQAFSLNKLGERILRSETAAVAATTIMLTKLNLM